MMAALFLVGAALLGAGLVRRCLRALLTPAEQLLWGVVVGWMLTTALAYLCARALGYVSAGALRALALATWAAALLLWRAPLKALWRREVRVRALWRGQYAGLLLVLGLFAPIYVRLFRTRMLLPGADGLYSGGSTWYDLGIHLALGSAFLYGRNFPPVYTPLPPAPLLYPFLPDFQTAALVALGASWRAALISTGVTLALALTGLFYSFALRVARAFGQRAGAAWRGLHEQAVAVLATILFLCNGGCGFIYFFEHWRKSNLSLRTFLAHLPANYANFGEAHIEWTNVVVDTLLPQRGALYGLPAAVMILTLFAAAWQRWTEDATEREQTKETTKTEETIKTVEATATTATKETDETTVTKETVAASATEETNKTSETKEPADARWAGARPLLVAGALTGLLPLFHPHSYIACGLLSGCLFLLRPRRAWLAYWLPALLLAAPQLLALRGHVATEGFLRWQPGWHAHPDGSWPLFWVRNVGLPALLIFPAWAAAPPAWRRFYLAFVGLLVFALLVMVSPSSYDNIKLLFYWYAGSCVLLAAWLVRLAAGQRQRFLALLLTLASILAGLLAFRFESQSRRLMFDREQLAAADFVRAHTAPRAFFLAAPVLHQPVLSLAGRPVLHGYVDWTWSHGYDFAARHADVKTIYAGGEPATELLRYYGVEYVYIGAAEREQLKANQPFFDQTYPAVYRGTGITIYDTRPRAPDGSAVEQDALARLAALPPREFAARAAHDPHRLIVEFPRAAYAVYRYYKVAYGRWPKCEEFLADMQTLGRGVYVGTPGWRETLERNKQTLTDGWLARPEFKQRYDALNDEQYVAALYANAGVAPPAAERAALLALLRNGAETRASVLRRAAENRQLYRDDYKRAYVLVHFFAYLRRDPDAPPDAAMNDYNYWLGRLNHTGDYRGFEHDFLGYADALARQR